MVMQRLVLSDVAGHRRLEMQLDDDLTPDHSVGAAIDLFLDRTRTRRNDSRFLAFTRGLRLDRKQRLGRLFEEFPGGEIEMAIAPEISAG